MNYGEMAKKAEEVAREITSGIWIEGQTQQELLKMRIEESLEAKDERIRELEREIKVFKEANSLLDVGLGKAIVWETVSKQNVRIKELEGSLEYYQSLNAKREDHISELGSELKAERELSDKLAEALKKAKYSVQNDMDKTKECDKEYFEVAVSRWSLCQQAIQLYEKRRKV